MAIDVGNTYSFGADVTQHTSPSCFVEPLLFGTRSECGESPQISCTACVRTKLPTVPANKRVLYITTPEVLIQVNSRMSSAGEPCTLVLFSFYDLTQAAQPCDDGLFFRTLPVQTELSAHCAGGSVLRSLKLKRRSNELSEIAARFSTIQSYKVMARPCKIKSQGNGHPKPTTELRRSLLP